MSDLINLKIPQSIIGIGSIDKLGELATGFNPARILVATEPSITKAGIMEKVQASLINGKCPFDIYDRCEPEPTYDSIINLVNKARDGKYDLLVGVGGGSVMDAVKVASQLIPHENITVSDLVNDKIGKHCITKILIPTTAGTGSEWSNVAVIYEDSAVKTEDSTRIYVSPQNYADAAIIDPALTLNLPQVITADTGMDALTHAIEAYTSRKSNVLSDMFAGEAIKLIAANLQKAFEQGPGNPDARYNMSIAASLAMGAVVISGVGMAHAANVPLGQKTKLSHGACCTLLLPHVMRFNLPADYMKFAQIALMMGKATERLAIAEAAEKSVEAVRELAKAIGMKPYLANTSITDDEIESMVTAIHTRKEPPINSSNPRDVTPDDTRKLLKLAIRGKD